MSVSDICAAYTPKTGIPTLPAMLKYLIYVQETEYCPEDQCDFAIQEDYRLYDNSTAGTLIIGCCVCLLCLCALRLRSCPSKHCPHWTMSAGTLPYYTA